MRDRRLRRRAAVLAVMTVLMSALTAPPARAASTQLPLKGFQHLLVDDKREQVFLSAGLGNDSIVVVDFNGRLVKEISNLPGASGMALVGDRLYVARQNGAAIDVVDADRLQKIDSLQLTDSSSGALAYAAGKLWSTTDACGQHGQLIAYDLQADVVLGPGGSYYCPLFRSSPLYPHTLFITELGLSPAGVSTLDVSDDPVTYTGSFQPSESAGNMKDVVISDDGSHGYTAAGAPYYVPEYRMSDMQPTGVNYPTGPYPVAAAQTSADGGYVAGAVAASEANVYVFRQGDTDPTQTSSVTPEPADRGLAFIPQTGSLFVVGRDYDETNPTLHVLEGPSAQAAEATLSLSPGQVRAGGRVEVTARVDAPAGETAELVIYAVPYARSRRPIASERVSDGGSVTATFEPSRNTTFVAHWRGTSSVLPATSWPHRVQVPLIARCRLLGAKGRSGKYALYPVDKVVEIRGRVDRKMRVDLAFFVDRKAKDGWRPLESRSFKTNREGRVTIGYAARRAGSYRVRTLSLNNKYGSDYSPWRYFRMTGG